MKSRRLMERSLRARLYPITLPGTAVIFDQLVGELLQVRWNFEVERLRSFEIDDQLKLGRRLHWKVGRSFTFEDTIDVPSRASNYVGSIRSIGDQCPSVANCR